MVRAELVVLSTIVAFVAFALCVRMSRAPLSRSTLETFAGRQRLTITPANGPRVVRCLAVARSWRRLGLTTGLVCGLLWAAGDARVTLNFTAGFLGWFVGAAIAEWRIAGLGREDGRRVASLDRRTVSSYLTMEARALAGLALLVLAASFVTVVVMTGATNHAAMTGALAWCAAAAAGLLLVGLTLRRVTTRRQQPVAADLLAADDALRARAAAVLAGSLIAAMGLPTAAMVELIAGQTNGGAGAWASAGVAVMLAEFLLGYLVATKSTAARRPSHQLDHVATAS
jgi:hypothetical protein